eukprot:INCI16371.1.p1 GENE.INCI16371.1~~INCI16371.1.p1  ORF type:complete len:914 (-),score=108.51 INCI16371.1:2333-5074(-)
MDFLQRRSPQRSTSCFAVAIMLGLGVGRVEGKFAAENGLTLKVYDNMALFGQPVLTEVVDAASIVLPGSQHNGAWSAELLGTVDFPGGFVDGGLYEFNCNFFNTTLGFVWVDGHLVCQDGNAYTNSDDEIDNPLPINMFHDSLLGPTDSLPFRVHVYYNANASVGVDPNSVASAGVFNDTGHHCGFEQRGQMESNDWFSAAQVCANSGFSVAGAEASHGEQVWCGNTVSPNCSSLDKYPHLKPCPGNASQTCGDAWVLETISFRTRDEPTAPASYVGVSVAWSTQHSVSAVPIPTRQLSPTLPVPEATRDSMQRSLASGWGPWLHNNMLSIVKLPEAASITTELCHIPTGKCLTVARPDGSTQGQGMPDVRVGLHAFDRSYVQFFFGSSTFPKVNVSVEYSVSGTNSSELDLLVTPISCGDLPPNNESCHDFEIRTASSYFWFKAGKVTTKAASLEFASPGFGSISIFGSANTTSTASTGSTPAALHQSLSGGPVALSTAMSPVPSEVKGKLLAAAEVETALLRDTFGANRMREGQAVKAAAMWTLVSTPIENAGAPLHPVSRSWNFAHVKRDDFSYAKFDWDNLFASLIAACGAQRPQSHAQQAGANPITVTSSSPVRGFGFAISNLIQIIKSKVAAGFVPNFAAGGAKSQDRSEPPVGAKVTQQLVEKFGTDTMQWVVEVVFDDLVDWSDWFIRKRLHPTLNLVALGSYNDQTAQAGNMQGARFESGLDNSPMYDEEFFNATNGCSSTESGCGLMGLYDVGFSSMFVQECYALANLSLLIGRPASLTNALRERGDDMAKLIRNHLWSESDGIFVNKFSANGTFYPRITPTSFYALQALAANDTQADLMATRWLMNASHFCITHDGSYAGNTRSCYWGLPSIQASDPAFPPMGYWRGYIWGFVALCLLIRFS